MNTLTCYFLIQAGNNHLNKCKPSDGEITISQRWRLNTHWQCKYIYIYIKGAENTGSSVFIISIRRLKSTVTDADTAYIYQTGILSNSLFLTLKIIKRLMCLPRICFREYIFHQWTLESSTTPMRITVWSGAGLMLVDPLNFN